MIMKVKDLLKLLNKFDDNQGIMLNVESKGLQIISDVISVKLFEDDKEECILLNGTLKSEVM